MWNKGNVIQWLVFVHLLGSPLVLPHPAFVQEKYPDLSAHREIARGSLHVNSSKKQKPCQP